MMMDEGILDPELPSSKASVVEEKITADRVACVYYYQSYLATYSNVTLPARLSPTRKSTPWFLLWAPSTTAVRPR